MALLDIKLRSQALKLKTNVTVIMPEKRDAENPMKILWLLHGLSDDNSVWGRYTGIERYLEWKNVCVIMPSVDRSFYADMEHGNKYYTYVSEELPQLMVNMLGISTKKEDNFVAGLSMGGYGAFKLALNQPERFSAAASLSGALDMQMIFENTTEDNEEINQMTHLIFGHFDNFIGSNSDLKHMAALKKDDKNLPALYMCCGKDDFLYQMNLGYLDYLKGLGIPVTYEEEAGYDHSWDYWDLKIKSVLEWMKLI